MSSTEAMLSMCEDTVIFPESTDAGIHNVFKDFGTNRT